jgi:hypothetical protein
MPSDSKRRSDTTPSSVVSTLSATAIPSASMHQSFESPGSQQPSLIDGYIPRPASLIGENDAGSTGKGILIGMLSAFGSAFLVLVMVSIVYFFKYTIRGKIILDRIGRPGEYDDEQAFAREEAEALEEMDDLQRTEYLRAKGADSSSLYPTR